jgi:hypothetical protein
MKPLFCLIIAASLFGGCKDPATYRMEISYVDMDFAMDFNVSPVDFDSAFYYVKEFEVTDSDLTKRIWRMTDSLVPSEARVGSLDARRQVRIWRNEELRTIYIGDASIFFDGKMYEYIGEIREALENAVKENDAKLNNAPATYRAELSYVYMIYETIDGIPCDAFDRTFESDIQKIEITDQEISKNIWDMMNELVVPSEFNFVDTRRKLRIWRNDELRVACIGNGTISFNGKMYKYDGEIREVLEDMIEANDARLESTKP